MTVDDLDDFTRAYLETLIWSSTPDEPTDDEHTAWDEAELSPEIIEQSWHECWVFQHRFRCFFELEGTDAQAGHDFALTRNEHGAGFWDGDWKVYGDMLTAGSHSFGTVDLYIGDDGLLYTT